MSLLPSQTKPLTPITWSIGRTGEAPDMHPGVILDMTTVAVTLRDGTTVVEPAAIIAVQLTAQEQNGGHKYLSMPRRGPVNTRFLWPRAKATSNGESLLIEGLDDFATVEDLQAKLMADNAAFLATQVASAPASLEEQAAAIVAEAAKDEAPKAPAKASTRKVKEPVASAAGTDNLPF